MLAVPNGDKRMVKKTALCWDFLNFFVKLSICLFLARIFMQSASRYDRLCLVSRALFVCSPLFKPVKGQFRQIAAKRAKSSIEKSGHYRILFFSDYLFTIHSYFRVVYIYSFLKCTIDRCPSLCNVQLWLTVQFLSLKVSSVSHDLSQGSFDPFPLLLQAVPSS